MRALFGRKVSNLFNDQPWITPEDSGVNMIREVRCLIVSNKETGQTLLVNSKGYGYPRYIAVEN